MGTLVRQQYTTKTKAGKTVTRTSKKWYIQFKDREGKWKRKAAYTDRIASTAMLVRIEAEIARQREGIYDHFTAHLAKPIENHIVDFLADVENRGNSKLHVGMTGQKIRWICTTADIATISDLTRSRVNTAIAALGVATNDRKAMSQATKNHYLTAIKAFSKWLVDDRRAVDNALAGVKGKSTGGEKTRNRRPLTADEFNKLLKSTATGPERLGISGPDRVALYLLGTSSGFRRRELSSIKPSSFHFGDEPHVILVRSYSKRRKLDRVPLNSQVAAFFETWLAGRPDETIWDIDRKFTATMIQEDMAAAGIEYAAGGQVVDFHSLRQTFVTGLALAGVAPKLAQQLARLSTVDLVMNTYTKVTGDEERAAVALLPAPDMLTQIRTQKTRRNANASEDKRMNERRVAGVEKDSQPQELPVNTGKKKGATRKTGRPKSK